MIWIYICLHLFTLYTVYTWKSSLLDSLGEPYQCTCIPVTSRSSLGHIQIAVPILESCWSAMTVSVWHLKLHKQTETNEPTSHSTVQPTKHQPCKDIGSAPCVAKALVPPEPAQPHLKKMPPCSQFSSGHFFISLYMKYSWNFLVHIAGWMMNASSHHRPSDLRRLPQTRHARMALERRLWSKWLQKINLARATQISYVFLICQIYCNLS